MKQFVDRCLFKIKSSIITTRPIDFILLGLSSSVFVVYCEHLFVLKDFSSFFIVDLKEVLPLRRDVLLLPVRRDARDYCLGITKLGFQLFFT